ncbi:MAG: TRAM domain-containing protein [Halobacteriota archaeon]
MEVSGELVSLVSSRLEYRDGEYVFVVPDSEVDDGDLEEGEVYGVGVLSRDETTDSGDGGGGGSTGSQLQPPVEKGEIRYVEVEDIGKQGDGIARVERGYVIIVPGGEIGDRVKVEVSEVKENFAVGEIIEEDAFE